VEKEKLVGQIEALKEKLMALEEELTETKQHNASLQVEIGSNRQNAVVSAAQSHQGAYLHVILVVCN
jgi:chromosome segregation ATPase